MMNTMHRVLNEMFSLYTNHWCSLEVMWDVWQQLIAVQFTNKTLDGLSFSARLRDAQLEENIL